MAQIQLNREMRNYNTKICSRIMCFMLVCVLLLTGFNLEDIQGDVRYSSNPFPVTSNHLLSSANENTSKAEVCTQEMLGIRESVFMGNTVRRVLSKRNTKNTLSLFFAILLLQLLFNAYLSVTNVHSYQAHGHKVILNYIHNQDGKK